MKLFFSEYKADYSQYHFPYQVYLKQEEGDLLDDIYNKGFLATRFSPKVFVLSRSLRIDMSKFKKTSENRRILRKTKYMDFEIHSLDDFQYHYSIGKIGKDFYKDHDNAIKTLGIKKLFKKGSPNKVFEYKEDGDSMGYALSLVGQNMLHYAYPFYILDYMKKNAGMGMMLKAIIWAKDTNIDYVYLGTVYTENSLYKLQFEGLEFFDGFGWNKNIEMLKEKVKNPQESHSFIQVTDKEKLIKNL